MSTYADNFKKPEWQKFRLEKLQAADWQCEHCRSKDEQLHIHHYWYERGRKPWDYNDEAIAVLCDRCHEDWHSIKDDLDQDIADMGRLGRYVMVRFSLLMADIKQIESINQRLARFDEMDQAPSADPR